jgi:hypothetical protein
MFQLSNESYLNNLNAMIIISDSKLKTWMIVNSLYEITSDIYVMPFETAIGYC